MDYEARYQEYQQAIEKYLDGLFTGDVAYGRLYEAMRYAILGGGKRIRPVLTLEFAPYVIPPYGQRCSPARPCQRPSPSRRPRRIRPRYRR